ncbi:hypothetical protein AMECASPLE_035531 [Ameca splendens]|uniref:Uncharacterized protein n=1 Tax=Ameca splendens TaxID=208324 RepID=A0ABV0ZT07_9TELE
MHYRVPKKTSTSGFLSTALREKTEEQQPCPPVACFSPAEVPPSGLSECCSQRHTTKRPDQATAFTVQLNTLWTLFILVNQNGSRKRLCLDRENLCSIKQKKIVFFFVFCLLMT